jgi:hypothetical protein
MTDFRITPEGVLSGYSGAGGAVVVPNTVTKVGWAAFRGMASVTSVALPAGVTEIAAEAFTGCTNLRDVSGATALRTVRRGAFSGTQVLSPPLGLDIRGGVLYWGAPENAPAGVSGYKVFMNGAEIASVAGTVNSLTLAPFVVNGPTLTVCVRALDGTGRVSLPSADIEYANAAVFWNMPVSVTGVAARSVAVTVNGNRAFAADSSTNTVRVFDASSNGSWTEVTGLGLVGTSVVVSADGQTVASVSGTTVRVASLGGGGGVTVLTGETGAVIALSADGRVLAVGSPAISDGKVLVYSRSDGGATGGWTLATTIFGEQGTLERFGCAVALSADGRVLAVGAEDAFGCGAVRIFTGASWVTQTTLYGEPGVVESFGASISLATDGKTLIIGAPFAGGAAGIKVTTREGPGAASIWRSNEGIWSQQKVIYSPNEGNRQFGTQVAISADGYTVAICDPVGRPYVYSANGNGTWPLAYQHTSLSMSKMALSGTGDKLVWGAASGFGHITHGSPRAAVFPSISTLLRAVSANDFAGAKVAAARLVADIQTGGGMLAGGIQAFLSRLPLSTALVTLLIASNLLPESLNALKSVIYGVCVGSLGVATDTYIEISGDALEAVMESVETGNRSAGYAPPSLYLYFPSTTAVVTDSVYPNVLYCVSPGVEYTFGADVVFYKRRNEAQRLLVELPGGASFVPPTEMSQADAVAWRMVNKYGMSGGTTLRECAEHWQANLPALPSASYYTTLAWIGMDLSLSGDAVLERAGRLFAEKYLPYARGFQRIAALDASDLTAIPAGYFVRPADGSIVYPSRIELTRLIAPRRIGLNAFDAAVTTLVLGGVEHAVAGGNLAMPAGSDAMTLWTKTFAGVSVLMPHAPRHQPANGVLQIPVGVAEIPDEYFRTASVTTVNFALCNGDTLQRIGRAAFPAGCRITVGGNAAQFYTYNDTRPLTRLGGVFYADFESAPTVAWYPTPLVTLDQRVRIPPRSSFVGFTCSGDVTFIVDDIVESDMYVWRDRVVDSAPLITDTARSHSILFDGVTYGNFRDSSNGVILQIGAGARSTLKLLSTSHKGHSNPAIEGFNTDLNRTGLGAGTALIVPARGTAFADTSGAAIKGSRYRFAAGSLAEGQTVYHGNVAWLNSRVAGASRVVRALTTPATRGIVYLQSGTASLYPHMFGPWRRSVTSIRESDGYNLAMIIPPFAFKDCENLVDHSLVFDRGVGESAFENCRALRSVFTARPLAGTSATVGKTGWFEIGARAFKGCSGLTTVVVDSDGPVVIYPEAFRDCPLADKVIINCRSFVDIKDNAFRGCTGIRQVAINARGSVAVLDSAFRGCSAITTLDISGTWAVTLDDNAFRECTGLTAINIQTSAGGVTVDVGAFRDSCATAASLNITSGGAHTVLIADDAFRGCAGLTVINVNSSGQMLIGANAFNGCTVAAASLTRAVTVPSSLTLRSPNISTLDATAFVGCTNLRAITVTSLSVNGFPFPIATYPNLNSLEVGWLNAQTLTTFATLGNKTSLQSVVFSGAGLTLATDHFSGCTQLRTLRVSNELTGFSAGMLTGCGILETLALNFRLDASGATTTCGLPAFTNFTTLKTVDISGGSVFTVPRPFCNGCTNLTTMSVRTKTLRVATGFTSIGNLLTGCTKLETLRFNETTPTVDKPIDITQIMPALRTLDVLGGLLVSGITPFWTNNVLEFIRVRGTLLAPVGTLPRATIKYVDIKAGGTVSSVIPPYAFLDCSGLIYFNMNGITRIEEGAFFGCTGISSFDFGNVLETIEDLAFVNTGLSGEIIIPESVNTLGRGYFIGCPRITKITYNCPVYDFNEPTRLSPEVVTQLLYKKDLQGSTSTITGIYDLSANEAVVTFDVSGEVVVKKGNDEAFSPWYNKIYSNGTITPTKIQDDEFYKFISESKFKARLTAINKILEPVMARHVSDVSGTQSWMLRPIWKLKDLGQACASTRNTLPVSAFNEIAEINPTGTQVTLNKKLWIGVSDASYNAFITTISPTILTHFPAALAANQKITSIPAEADSWYHRRIEAIDAIIVRVVAIIDSDPIENSWLFEAKTNLLKLIRKCMDIRATLPTSAFDEILVLGPAQNQFTLNKQAWIGVTDASFNAFVSAVTPTFRTHFPALVSANQNLFTTVSEADKYPVSLPVTLLSTQASPFKVQLLLPQFRIHSVTGDNDILLGSGTDVIVQWYNPTIQTADCTTFEVNGVVKQSLAATGGASRKKAARWIYENSQSRLLDYPNNIALAFRGEFTVIEYVDNKKSTIIDISSELVSIHQHAFSDISNCTININSLTMLLDNYAFRGAYMCTFNFNTTVTPRAGIGIFSGSLLSTLNSNKLLINEPNVVLAPIGNKKLDDVVGNISINDASGLIYTYTGVDPQNTRNVQIGTFMPQKATTTIFTPAFAYIEFQELPSLRMHYILQQPEDWFWASYADIALNGYHIRPYFGYTRSGKLHYLNKSPEDPITQGTLQSQPWIQKVVTAEDLIKQIGEEPEEVITAAMQKTGLKNNFAPKQFRFAGYLFTRRDVSGERVDNVTDGNPTFRALRSFDENIQRAVWNQSPGGSFTADLVDIAINIAVLILVSILTFGVGTVLVSTVGPLTSLAGQVLTAAALEVGSAFLIKATNYAVKNGTIGIGELTTAFWIQLAVGLVFALAPEIAGPVIKVVKGASPSTGGRLVRQQAFRYFLAPRPELGVVEASFEKILVTEGPRLAPGKVIRITRPKPKGDPVGTVSFSGGKGKGQLMSGSNGTLSAAPDPFKKSMEVTRNIEFGTKKDVPTITDGDINPLPKPPPADTTPSKPQPDTPAVEESDILPEKYRELAKDPKNWNNTYWNRIRHGENQRWYGDLYNQDKVLVFRLRGTQLKDATLPYKRSASLMSPDGREDVRNVNAEADELLRTTFINILDDHAIKYFKLTSATDSARTILNQKRIFPSLKQDIPATLSEIAAYNCQILLPSMCSTLPELREDENSGKQFISGSVNFTESYLAAYYTAPKIDIPPSVLPNNIDPAGFTKDPEKPSYMMTNFLQVGNGVNHPYIDREPTGRPVAVWPVPNPLLVREIVDNWSGNYFGPLRTRVFRSPYTWRDTYFGPPRSANNLETNAVNATNFQFNNSTGILTLLSNINTEIYLGNRRVNYDMVREHAPNLVFCGASELNINIPASYTGIADYAFAGTSGSDNNTPFSLGVVTIQSTAPGFSIGKRAFYQANIRELRYFTDTTTGVEAFGGNFNMVIYKNNALTGVTGFGPPWYAGGWGTGLTGIRDVEPTVIGPYAFTGCVELNTTGISAGCVEIGEGAYLNCEGLREFVRLPTGLRTVGASAFAGTTIVGVTIPPSVESVGEFAFPEGACVVLEAGADGMLTPALGEVFASLEESNVVFVSTAEAMAQVLPYISDRVVRILVEPPAPSDVRMEDGCVVWDVGRDLLAAPAYSYVVCVTSASSGEVVEEHVDVVRSGACRLKSVGGEFLVSVVAQNPAGDSEAAVLQVVL